MDIGSIGCILICFLVDLIPNQRKICGHEFQGNQPQRKPSLPDHPRQSSVSKPSLPDHPRQSSVSYLYFPVDSYVKNREIVK